MDSDLAWVNGKSGRQSWRYHADAFQRSIISEAIYHLPRLKFWIGSDERCRFFKALESMQQQYLKYCPLPGYRSISVIFNADYNCNII